MNDTVLLQLKTTVERAVRPVVASRFRKRQMREELLGHLTASYEEDYSKLGDESAALASARRRFGDPRELSAELQATVSRWDRVRLAFQKVTWEPDDSLARSAVKHLILGIATYAIILFELAVVLWIGPKRGFGLGFALQVAFATGIFVPLFSYALCYLADGIRRAVYADGKLALTRANVRQVIPFLVASLMFLPLLAFMVHWLIAGDVAAGVRHMRLGCLLAPLAPVLFTLMAGEIARQQRYEKEWASLMIDEGQVSI